MKRRMKGEGSPIAQKKDGKIVGYRWRVRSEGEETWGPVSPTKRGALSRYKESVAKKLAKLEAEPLRLGPKLSSSLVLLIENRLVNDWRPKTVTLARLTLGHIRKHPIGERGLDEITEAKILEWRLWLQSNGLQDSTVHRYQRVLERMLALLGRRVTAPKPRLRQPDVRILTREEQRELINRAVQPRTRLALLILIGWGLRSGEACGLMHEDRHENGVWLRRVVTGTGQVDETMKTDESRAWLPFVDDELEQLIGPPRTGYVLATANGTPMAPNNLRRMVQSVAEGTAYEGITPQELRHTAGVNMLRAGIDPATAASITRHSVETLLKIYHRVIVESKVEAMEKLRAWRDAG